LTVYIGLYAHLNVPVWKKLQDDVIALNVIIRISILLILYILYIQLATYVRCGRKHDTIVVL